MPAGGETVQTTMSAFEEGFCILNLANPISQYFVCMKNRAAVLEGVQ